MSVVRKAIIIGGGPAGLCTALRLRQTTNIECSVYELRSEPTTLGGAIGILANGLRLLNRLGVYDALAARGNSRSTLICHSSQGGVLGAQQDATAYARKHTGFGYMRIKRTDLVEVLLEATRNAKIPVHFGKQITSIKDAEESVTVTFSDGTTETADILFGCDGIHSQVRQLHVDPGLAPEYTGISGLLSILPVSCLPPSAASQLSGFDMTLTEDGMFAAMHCTAAGDEVYWGFSREMKIPGSDDNRDGWEVHRKDEVEGFKSNLHRILESVHGDWGNALRQIVDSTAVVKFYPVHKLPLGGAWSKGRCVLIGDAAHAMPPHAGQGVSMILEDAFLLCRLLQDSGRPLSGVFEKYDQIRRPRVDEIHKQASRNGNARRKSGPWGLWMKEIMIKASIWVPATLGLDKLGYGQQHLLYDIDQQKIQGL